MPQPTKQVIKDAEAGPVSSEHYQSGEHDQSARETQREKITDESTVTNTFRPLPRADRLKDHHLDEISIKSLLISHMNNGMSARDALDRVQLRGKRSVSWAQKLYRNSQKRGPEALIDKRWQRQTEVRVMTSEVKKLVDYFCLEFPAAGARAIWKDVCEECRYRNFPEPSYSSVKQYIASQSKSLKLLRKGNRGLRQWSREGRPVIRYENTKYANELWQVDDCHLPIWVRHKVNGQWEPCYAFFTDGIDVHSRSIPGFILSTRDPDAWSAKLFLRKAILPKANGKWANKGIPFYFQTDRHKNFRSRELAAAAAYLRIELEPNPAHYPDANGKIERFHRTLNEGCLKRLPGHMEAIGKTFEAAEKHILELLTVAQLRREIESWITDDYHQTVHSETGRKPAELWAETVRLNMPDDEDALNRFLLHTGEIRTVKNVGVEYAYDGIRHTYWVEEIVPYYGCKVFPRFNPDDMESVFIYHAASGEFICEAWDLRSEDPRRTIADIKRARSQFLMGLSQRLKEHYKQIEDDDRPLKVQRMLKEIREAQATQEADLDIPDSANAAMGEAEGFDPDLLARFKAYQRGEIPTRSDSALKEEDDHGL